MIVAIASGKGGTGKTTLAINLAVVMSRPLQLLDCDVEAPNAHLFLRPEIAGSQTVGIPVPVIDEERCNLCGDCAGICQFNAIAVLRTGTMVFPELCHGCGGCNLVCPEAAIREAERPVGTVEWGRSGEVEVVSGRLSIGEAMAPPVIRALIRRDRPVLIDAPPGNSCPTVSAIRGSDLVLLVTEPTPFGLNDLRLAVETVRTLGLPLAVVVNRVGNGDRRVHDYCDAEKIEILAEIPDDRRAAEASARGLLLVEHLPEFREAFSTLANTIESAVHRPQLAAAGGGPP